MTNVELKQKLKDVIDQFNSEENSFIGYETLLQPMTLIIGDENCFYIDKNSIAHYLSCVNTFDNENDGFTGGIYFYDYSSGEKIKNHEYFSNSLLHIYVNSLDNEKYGYFVENGNLYRKYCNKLILCICKNIDVLSAGNEDGICIGWIEREAFSFISNVDVDELDLSKLESLSAISDMLFNHSAFSHIKKVILPQNIQIIGERAFSCCSALDEISSVNDFQNLRYIGYSSFRDCYSLKHIDLSKSQLSIILYSAFNGCSSLQDVSLPNSLKNIFGKSFYSCTSLSSINIEDTQISSLYDYEFYGCSSLKQLKMPESIVWFSKSSIFNCTQLKSLSFEKCSAEVSVLMHDYQEQFSFDDLSIFVQNNVADKQPLCFDESYNELSSHIFVA